MRAIQAALSTYSEIATLSSALLSEPDCGVSGEATSRVEVSQVRGSRTGMNGWR
jgi:hypothetical protein